MREFDCADKLFLGELALDGRLRPVNVAQKAADAGHSYIFLPRQNANEAAAIEKIKVIAVDDLCHAITLLEKRVGLVPTKFDEGTIAPRDPAEDFFEIKG
jgi:magnesium chelatase family protein